MSRLLWLLTTPRRLRRNILVLLLLWTVVAFAHQNLELGGENRFNLPVQVPSYSSQ